MNRLRLLPVVPRHLGTPPKRKMQVSGATELASKGEGASDGSNVKVKVEIDDPLKSDMKVGCPCGNSLETENIIKLASTKTRGQLCRLPYATIGGGFCRSAEWCCYCPGWGCWRVDLVQSVNITSPTVAISIEGIGEAAGQSKPLDASEFPLLQDSSSKKRKLRGRPAKGDKKGGFESSATKFASY
ncbi:hypothetical protein V6N12_026935 [Hibiscus sabdariffa]|uniref:Uncharacterized protein n=1 Tax=Hibiscus sabdariffa TaxID=183260 RepID=A0ABR2DT77_9ROSI